MIPLELRLVHGTHRSQIKFDAPIAIRLNARIEAMAHRMCKQQALEWPHIDATLATEDLR